ncbi:MAG TPA: alpha/beta hydrolase [Chloroflexaceae bacterium]|nr:alpha/beta hydrolase [Chloroflexaceae bacterium]
MSMGHTAASPRCRHEHIGAATIYSEVTGAGSPVVLIHGLAGSTRWWGRNIKTLARDHEVHTVDLVGSGRSVGRFVLRDAASTVAQWMERCGVGPAAVIGHSMGGHIAADLAASHPHLVSRLVLVDAALSFAGAPQPKAQDLSTLSYLPFGMLPLILPEAVKTGLPNLARAAYEIMRRDMAPVLAQIRARTLVVWGEHDPCVPLSLGYRLASMLPGNALAVIRAAGHVPMWEQPAAFNSVVTAFLHSHDGAVQPTPNLRLQAPTRLAS